MFKSVKTVFYRCVEVGPIKVPQKVGNAEDSWRKFVSYAKQRPVKLQLVWVKILRDRSADEGELQEFHLTVPGTQTPWAPTWGGLPGFSSSCSILIKPGWSRGPLWVWGMSSALRPRAAFLSHSLCFLYRLLQNISKASKGQTEWLFLSNSVKLIRINSAPVRLKDNNVDTLAIHLHMDTC